MGERVISVKNKFEHILGIDFYCEDAFDGVSVIVNDPDVFQLSEAVELEEIPGFSVPEQTVTHVDSEKQLLCIKCGKKFSSDPYLGFHTKHCTSFDNSNVWGVFLKFS